MKDVGNFPKTKCVPRRYNDKMHWESIIEKSGPDDFIAQTVNGSTRWKGTGWNQVPPDWNTSPQVPPMPTRPAGRSNRTGE